MFLTGDIFQALPFLGLILLTIVLTLLIVGGMLLIVGILVIRFSVYKEREQESLKSKLLQITIPRDNEVKIDAAEQMFSAFTGIYKSALIPMLKHQPSISFEIVGQPESIKFYINAPEELQDLIEKQIHAAYSGAEIKIVDEYNIFTTTGKVQFASLRLKSANYQPIKTYKELATDPLSALTSALAKMREGEGAVIQMIIAPAGGKWSKRGYSFIKAQRSQETSGEKPKPADAKQLEAIEQKTAKPGYETAIRIVVCAQTKDMAKTHLNNIRASFEQFNGPYNGFKTKKNLVEKSISY